VARAPAGDPQQAATPYTVFSGIRLHQQSGFGRELSTNPFEL
jgi:hypothetical protein